MRMKGRLTSRRFSFYLLSLSIIIIAARFGSMNDRAHQYDAHEVFERNRADRPNVTKNRNEKNSSSSKPTFKISDKVLSNASIGVILAYMRTGSTLTGEVLRSFPNTFYLFEPLIRINQIFVEAKNVTGPVLYPNGTVLFYKSEDRSRVMLQELIDCMTCNFGNLSVTSLSSRFNRRKSKQMSKLRRITLRLVENKTQSLYTSEEWKESLEETQHICKVAPIRLLKLVRTSMAEMKHLMPKFPNMKILHLNRDPRAVHNSRILVTVDKENLHKYIVEHCARWSEDIEMTNDIIKTYPGRLKRIRYEDMAQYPLATFKAISDFFGVEFEPDIKAFLLKVTNAINDTGPWAIERVNPYHTAMRWRHQLNFENASEVAKLCEKGMKDFNYNIFTRSEDMKNQDLPVRGPLSNADGHSIIV